jgi:hypothetical protein
MATIRSRVRCCGCFCKGLLASPTRRLATIISGPLRCYRMALRSAAIEEVCNER